MQTPVACCPNTDCPKGLEPVLKVVGLSKAYRFSSYRYLAVDNVCFSIGAGECLGFLGPNGAGKSTIMNCVTGFYSADTGEIRIGGFAIEKEPRKAKRFLGVCSQEDTLDTDFTVLDQMIRYGTYFGLSVSESRTRSLDLLSRFHLEEKAHQLVERLSGGMRRRLQVARALVSQPQLLVLDEPSSGLDPALKREFWDIIAEYKSSGRAILLTTHDMEEAHRLSDRVILLSRGRVIDCDQPEQLIRRHCPQAEVIEEIRPGVTLKRPANLEDVYLGLTGQGL